MVVTYDHIFNYLSQVLAIRVRSILLNDRYGLEIFVTLIYILRVILILLINPVVLIIRTFRVSSNFTIFCFGQDGSQNRIKDIDLLTVILET